MLVLTWLAQVCVQSEMLLTAAEQGVVRRWMAAHPDLMQAMVVTSEPKSVGHLSCCEIAGKEL